MSILKTIIKSSSAWAIADQVIASAGNFATALVLARGLPTAEFGVFVLINSACLIGIGLHGNLIISPLVVLGVSGDRDRSRIYPTVALMFTLAMLPAVALVVLPASQLLHRGATGILALIYVLAWQFQETMRRTLISRRRYRDAMWGDGFSYVGQAMIVALLFQRPGMTLNLAFLVMAATSLAAATLQGWQLKLVSASLSELRKYAFEFWVLGKWLAIVSLISLIASPLFPWLLNWFHGKEAVAIFQATMNVFGLANPLILSIPAIIMPAAANLLSGSGATGRRSLIDLSMKHVLLFEGIIAPWLLLLLLWPHEVLTLIYGKASIYSGQTGMLRLGVLVCIFNIPMAVMQAALTGVRKTKSNAVMYGVGSITSLVFAPIAIFAGGVFGAMLSEAVTRGSCLLAAMRSLYAIPAISHSLGDSADAEYEALRAQSRKGVF